MKISRILFALIILIILPTLGGCNAEKQIAARRNLMMPEKTDLPRNSKFQGSKNKKTYKPKKKVKKKKRR